MMTAPFPPGLPSAITDLVEFHPIEDVIAPILEERLPGLVIKTLIEDDPPATFVLVRRAPPLGYWPGDSRLVDYARLYIQVYVSDPNGDEKGALISEAVRVSLRDAALVKDRVEGKGTLVRQKMLSDPTRKTDWANSQGPVQFADLPTGMWRYESVYEVWVRRPR